MFEARGQGFWHLLHKRKDQSSLSGAKKKKKKKANSPEKWSMEGLCLHPILVAAGLSSGPFQKQAGSTLSAVPQGLCQSHLPHLPSFCGD